MVDVNWFHGWELFEGFSSSSHAPQELTKRRVLQWIGGGSHPSLGGAPVLLWMPDWAMGQTLGCVDPSQSPPSGKFAWVGLKDL